MRGDPDLYPPDDEELTPEIRAARSRAFWGVALVTFGCGLILDYVLPFDIDIFFLAVGFGLTAAWLVHRRYAWFVAAAIVSSIGASDLLESFIGGAIGDSLSCFVIAAGFAAIYVRYPYRSSWALVPAAIFAVIGIAIFGFGIVGIVADAAAGVLLPGLLIAGGALLLGRSRVSPKALRVGLAVLAGLFVLVAISSGNGPTLPSRTTLIERQQQMSIYSHTEELIVETQSADVEISGTIGTGMIEVEGSPIRVYSDAPNVQRVVARSGSVELRLPEDIKLVVTTQSGDISGEVPGEPTIDAETQSGEIEIDDEDFDDDETTVEGTDGRVVLSTRSGDIDIEREAA